MAIIPILGIVGLFTWKSQEKQHLGVTLVVNHKEYYKGESDGFPQVQIMMSFIRLCMHVVHMYIKNVPIMH